MSAPTGILVAGHVCLDVIPAMKGPLPAAGGLAEVGEAVVSTGGAVSNVGIALHKLGVPTRLAGRLGDDAFGREVRRLYARVSAGLDANLRTVVDQPTSYTVVLSPAGEDRRFMHCPGVNETFTAADVTADSMSDMAVMHFGYPPVMRAMCENDGQQLRMLFRRAKEAGLMTSLDLCSIDPHGWPGDVDWPMLLDNVLPEVDVFLPSLDELLTAYALPAAPPDRRLLRELTHRILEAGAAVAGIKMGEKGVYLRTTSNESRLGPTVLDPEHWCAVELHGPTFEVDVINTTGAGDVTIAGFLTAAIAAATPKRAVDIACAAGAFCVGCVDATSGVPTFKDVERHLERNTRRRPAMF